MDRERIRQVVKEDRELPVSEVLRLIVRYFTDGMVLGPRHM